MEPLELRSFGSTSQPGDLLLVLAVSPLFEREPIPNPCGPAGALVPFG